MNNLNFVKNLVFKIAEIGSKRKIIDAPTLQDVEPFRYFFDKNSKLKRDKIDTIYIRVTNIRGKKVQIKIVDKEISKNYEDVVLSHFKTRKRKPTTIEIQQLPNAILLNSNFGIGDFDDGLIYIGTNFCFNQEKPKCDECPLNKICKGFNENKSLIKNYRT